MAIQTYVDQQLAILRPKYPGWDLWVVRVVYGSDVWCAKRKDRRTAEINTDSPEHLVAEIAKLETASQ
jgi:hypothetical protein